MTFTPSGVFYVQTDRTSLGGEGGAIWEVDPDTGVATLELDNAGRVRGMETLSDGRLVLADAQAHTLSIYDPTTDTMTPLAGSPGLADFADGSGAAARFNRPLDVAVTSSDEIYVADAFNHRIRHVTLAGVVTTVAGDGTEASTDGNALSSSLNTPAGLALDGDTTLMISEFDSGLIRQLSAGALTTIAGSSPGFADNTDPLLGQLFVCEGIDFAAPYLYISDGNGGTGALFNRVRRLDLTP
jgi:hypothetical protein